MEDIQIIFTSMHIWSSDNRYHYILLTGLHINIRFKREVFAKRSVFVL